MSTLKLALTLIAGVSAPAQAEPIFSGDPHVRPEESFFATVDAFDIAIYDEECWVDVEHLTGDADSYPLTLLDGSTERSRYILYTSESGQVVWTTLPTVRGLALARCYGTTRRWG